MTEQPQEAKAWYLNREDKRFYREYDSREGDWLEYMPNIEAIVAESHRRGVEEGRREMVEELIGAIRVSWRAEVRLRDRPDFAKALEEIENYISNIITRLKNEEKI